MRQSNIEIVRIIAMSMIVVWHFLIHGGIIENYPNTELLKPVVYGGVPLFILVSGWFLINVNWKSIIRLIVTLWIFYFFIELFLILLGFPINFGRIVLEFLSPLSRYRLWFVGIYTALIFVSPLINIGLKHLSINNLRVFILLYSIFEFYSCWIFNNRADDSGYSLTTFLYIYVLGYYIRRDPFISKLSSNKLVMIGLIALASNIILTYLLYKIRLLHLNSNITNYINLDNKYSNPLLIIECCSIILLFSRLKLSSKKVNTIASASFGVYLLQDCTLGDELLYPLEHTLIENGSKSELAVYLLITFISLWVLSYLIMHIVRFVSPYLENLLSKRLFNIDFNK